MLIIIIIIIITVTNYTMMQISNEEHSQLEFPSPTNIQEGFYHCEARNDLGKDNL